MSPYRPPIRPVIVRPPQPGAVPRPPRPPSSAAPGAPAPPKPPSPLECLRVARVARLLDVSKKRVYQLVQERRLEVIRLGPRQMRVLKPSLERFVGRLIDEEIERDY